MQKEADYSWKKAKEDATLLNHLVSSLDDSEKKLEEFYTKKDSINFNKTKKFILTLGNKISELSK
jgi:hypothetical protein